MTIISNQQRVVDLRRRSILLESSADVVLDCRRQHSVVMIVMLLLEYINFSRCFVRLHFQLRWALRISAHVLAVKILLLVDGLAGIVHLMTEK
jgi:hypothetical protein